MADIDVDIEQLANFIGVFNHFQQEVENRMRTVELAWGQLADSWKGDAATNFKPGFEKTSSAVQNALKDGEEVLDWLRRYHEIIEEFEGL